MERNNNEKHAVYYKTAQWLKQFCTQETCYPKIKNMWTEENSFWGHCAIIALYMYNQYGGSIFCGNLVGDKLTHYWNRIDGVDMDFTREQFKSSVKFENVHRKRKSDMLENKNFSLRFDLFLQQINSSHVKK